MKTQTNVSSVHWAALTGFSLGVLGATTYLLCDGDYFLNVPRWATFVFYPGFVAGFHAYGWGLRELAAQLVGVAAVGLTYAVIAVVLDFAWLALRAPRGISPKNASIDPGF